MRKKIYQMHEGDPATSTDPKHMRRGKILSGIWKKGERDERGERARV